MIFAEENAGKLEFTLQPGDRSPSFAPSAHADKSPGAEGQELFVEAAVLCSFLPCSTVGTQAGTVGKPRSQGCPVAQNSTPPLQSPSATALQLSCHGASENTSEKPQIWFSHMKNGRSLVSFSAISMAKNKLVQGRNWCTTKPESFLFPQRVGRAQSMNQIWCSCFPYKAVQARPMAWAALWSCFL